MSVLRLHPECIRCMLDKQLAKCPADAPKEVQLAYMQKILSIASQAPSHQGAPVMLDAFHKLQRDMFGIDKDFGQIKRKYNAVMMQRVPEMQKRIDASERSLAVFSEARPSSCSAARKLRSGHPRMQILFRLEGLLSSLHALHVQPVSLLPRH